VARASLLAGLSADLERRHGRRLVHHLAWPPSCAPKPWRRCKSQSAKVGSRR